jgi:hypothetical protein
MLDKTMARISKAGLDAVVRPLLCTYHGIGAPLLSRYLF